MNKTYIVIPTWNNEDYTIRCFDSIRKNTKEYKLIWVDNGSEKESREKVKKFLEKNLVPYEVILNEKNEGFVIATNQGIQKSLDLGAEYIVLQNNDTEVYEGWLEKMFNAMNSNKDIGIIGPVVSPTKGSWQSIENLKYKIDLFSDLPEYNCNNEQYAKKISEKYNQKIFVSNRYIAFFCTLIKREVFEDVGLLSEDYGIGFGDDNDFGNRAMKLGWILAVAMDVFIFHNHRTTFKSIFSDDDIKKLMEKNKNILEKNTTIRDQLTKIKKQEQEIESIKSSKTFLIGDLFFRSIRRPLKLMFFPYNFFRILYGKNNKIDQANALNKSNYIYQSTGGKMQALENAKKHVPKRNKNAISILKANMESDESLWISHVNQYLENQDLNPIFLKKENGDLFDRFICDVNYCLDEKSLISVIMPAYNAEKTIRMAVKSILNQTWSNLELLIVDDCSSDGTWDIIKKIAQSDNRVRIYRNKVNVGPYVSKNIALRVSKGEYITGHDADDWSHPQRLERQMQDIISSNGKIKATLARMLRLNEERQFHIQRESVFSIDGAMRTCSISLLIEKKFLTEKCGYWDSIKCGADSELIDRLQIILGDRLKEQYFISMICLNAEGSLTNDPIIGVHTKNGMSQYRMDYTNSWKKWHKTVDLSNCYLDFPQKERLFDAPDKLRISTDDVLQNISND